MVPNAPCGVERFLEGELSDVPVVFLMHRVELKELLEYVPYHEYYLGS